MAKYTAYLCDECGRRDLSEAEIDKKKDGLTELHFCNQSCEEKYFEQQYQDEIALEEHIKKQNEVKPNSSN